LMDGASTGTAPVSDIAMVSVVNMVPLRGGHDELVSRPLIDFPDLLIATPEEKRCDADHRPRVTAVTGWRFVKGFA
jgi:hypothetical protein